MVVFLEVMQANRALHRDIKPENIILGADWYLKVIDFGYATYLPENGLITDRWCGTLEYNCPQKHRHEPYGLPSDIWSLGVLLYVMVMDRFPFGSRGVVHDDFKTKKVP